MEDNTRKTFPERSQRDYWEFNTKNKNNHCGSFSKPNNHTAKNRTVEE
jgi:hypothetical protein